MGAYEETSWADLRALTRERRAQAHARMLEARAAHERLAFEAMHPSVHAQIEAAWREADVRWAGLAPHQVWKNEQWAAGARSCGYCGVRMTRTPNVPRTCTVDHKHPKAYGGRDEPGNWLLACLGCNGLKGSMMESTFRALIARRMAG